MNPGFLAFIIVIAVLWASSFASTYESNTKNCYNKYKIYMKIENDTYVSYYAKVVTWYLFWIIPMYETLKEHHFNNSYWVEETMYWDTEEACKKFLEIKYNCDKKEPKTVKHLKVYSKK